MVMKGQRTPTHMNISDRAFRDGLWPRVEEEGEEMVKLQNSKQWNRDLMKLGMVATLKDGLRGRFLKWNWVIAILKQRNDEYRKLWTDENTKCEKNLLFDLVLVTIMVYLLFSISYLKSPK